MSRVVMMPHGVSQQGLEALTLAHPRTGSSAKYVVAGADVLEVQEWQPRKPASWLVEQRVISEGGFYLCTKVDPVFLLLPLLEKRCEKPTQIAQVFEVVGKPCYRVLGALPGLTKHLSKISKVDETYGQDVLLVEFDRYRAQQWLVQKTETVARKLADSGNSPSDNNGQVSSAAPNFHLSQSDQSLAKRGPPGAIGAGNKQQISDPDLEFALALIGEYLPPKWNTWLLNHFRPVLEERQAEMDLLEEETLACKISSASNELKTTQDVLDKYRAAPVEHGSKPAVVKKPELSFSQKQLAKVDKRGMKSLSTFFTKKKKEAAPGSSS